MVEHEPSKLVMWVRFPSPAPFCFAIQREKLGYGFAETSTTRSEAECLSEALP